MKKHFEGTLEVDEARGVVYFHHKEGGCLLRIDGLESPDAEKAQIDIRIRRGLEAPVDIPRKDLCGKIVIAEVVMGGLKEGITRHKEDIKNGNCCSAHKYQKREG